MLSWRQTRAIKLMFHKTDEEVAQDVRVRPETVARWRQDPEFRKALAAEARAIRAAAARITSDASLMAAKNLHKMLEDGKDAKLALDTLKASGAFEEREEAPEVTLEDLINSTADGDEDED